LGSCEQICKILKIDLDANRSNTLNIVKLKWLNKKLSCKRLNFLKNSQTSSLKSKVNRF